jgi:hypothetical protein
LGRLTVSAYGEITRNTAKITEEIPGINLIQDKKPILNEASEQSGHNGGGFIWRVSPYRDLLTKIAKFHSSFDA